MARIGKAGEAGCFFAYKVKQLNKYLEHPAGEGGRGWLNK